MRYNGKNLSKLLLEHQKWVLSRGEKGSCADFAFCLLENVDLSNKCLPMANFFGATLIDVNFTNANINKANLSQTHIQRAIFDYASLYRTIFTNARIGIQSAMYADMTETVFTNSWMDIESDVQIKLPINCPSSGSFIGWKKANIAYPKSEQKEAHISQGIVKLLIPEWAERTSSVNRQCRCDRAIVLDVQDTGGASIVDYDYIFSAHDLHYKYTVGDTLLPRDSFDTNRWHECSSGIHFFIDRMDAVDYII